MDEVEKIERWVILACLLLTAILGWAAWDASTQEWEGYQESYYRLALLRANSEAQKEWVRAQPVEIKQLQPREHRSVERCITCHLAVDNPMFRDAPEPFRAHPSLLVSHPAQRFGCVVCHGGEGRAVTTLEGHGQGNIRAKPLLRGEYMQAACYSCHGEANLSPKAVAAVVRGRQLVNRYLCLGCHQIRGVGGEEGPDLSAVGSNRSWLWLYAHLARPQAIVVGSTMPVFLLSRAEVKDITIYLMTLLDSRDRFRNTPPAAEQRTKSYQGEEPKEEAKKEKENLPENATAEKFRYDGGLLFHGAGCSLCHSIGNRGGEVGPALTYIGRKRKTEELERLLRDPEEVLPGGKMPQLYLNDEQIKTLAAYLSTLQ